jgi:protein arginine N-methyltransferase 1
MTSGYDVVGYGRMLADHARMDAYARALEATVRPGSVVLDIGTGTGVMAMLACRFGARRVFALEPADAVQVAREIARANGVADRIEFIQALSTRVTLPERADVIVSDLRGSLPLFQGIIDALADARERHLARGGVMIPRADHLMAAPVDAAAAWAEVVAPWDECALGFDMDAARRRAVHAVRRVELDPGQQLAPAARWATLDYQARTDPHAAGTPEWRVERAGRMHGLAVWFHAELADGVSFHTGPGTRTTYRTSFLPWAESVEVEPGDTVRAELSARRVAGEYVWGWSARVERPGRKPAEMRHSTFFAAPPSPARLRRRDDGFCPSLSDDGRVEATALSMMDGATPLGDVATALEAAFPHLFPTREAALTRAGQLAERLAG